MDKENKIQKRYGMSVDEFKNADVETIKSLKITNAAKKKELAKSKLIKKPIGIITKGASIGAGVAGAVNTAFPNLIPTIGGYITGSKAQNALESVVGILGFASKPVEVISGPTVLGIGAACGAVLYGGYRLVKACVNNAMIANDKKKVR